VAIAHTRNRQGNRHALVEHLRQVTALAAEFAAPFGASLFGNVLGTWHDLGKFHPDFQKYLFDAEANPQKHPRGPDHKAAGVLMALHHKQEALSLPLQGHHGGLHNRQQLKAWFEPHMARAEQALVAARLALPELNDPVALQLPPFLFIEGKLDPLRVEMFLRMLFSCLVDADFLDTEQHFEPERASARGGTRATMAELWECFERDQQRMSDRPATRVNRARAGIYQACIEAAEQPPGLYRLTVPTGGGKTRSGLAFALRQALLYDLRRVVVAVPFTTITQQTAKVFRDIFAPLAGDEPIVLEHHSASTEWGVEDEEFASAAQWSRLAAENWDAPVVVTTTVQLFESLFAASTRRCRKLHRLARSVIILDEVQSLPVSLLDPILNALTILCSDYGCTVVLSTATQPAFEMLPIFANVQAREIMPDPARHFRTLKRVAYTWHLDPPLTWEQVAALLREHAQALVVLNTKKDALALLDALGDPDALHLSTLLCGKHRQDVLEEIKRRLDNGEACRVVSTQVVEAGVDLDFPVVLRALGPLRAAGTGARDRLQTRGGWDATRLLPSCRTSL
jgi:CRISPR-associated endonuclease/helicase Cas3